MRPISKPKATNGFTLIEVTVIVVVLVIIAAAVLPKFENQVQSQQAAELPVRFATYLRQVRLAAVSNQTTMILTYDDSTRAFEAKADTTADPNLPTNQNTTQSQTTDPTQFNQTDSAGNTTQVDLKSLDLKFTLPDNVDSPQFGQTNSSGQTTNSSTLNNNFYSDGSADPLSVTFGSDNSATTIQLDPLGHIQIINGPAPDPTTQSWPAGDLEQRQ